MFNELSENIRKCKNKIELDDMRMPLVRFVPNGGSVDDFYKLQKLFRKQKNRIARGTVG